MTTSSTSKAMVAALTGALLAGCGAPVSTLPAAVGGVREAHRASGPVPPACTTAPKVKSGTLVTSIAAFGNVERNRFSLAKPSSWMQVEWLSAPSPGKRRSALPVAPRRGAQSLEVYFGTYTVSDGTVGCFYVVTRGGGDPIDGKSNTAITAQPRIPTTGATLPHDYGSVKNLQLRLPRGNEGGAGTMTLVHYDGSDAMTGTIKIVGRVN